MAKSERGDEPVIVHVASRHEMITVTASPDGPRYTAKGKDGRLLADKLTLRELQARHPDLARHVDPTIAARADGDEADASLGAIAPPAQGTIGRTSRGDSRPPSGATGDRLMLHAE